MFFLFLMLLLSCMLLLLVESSVHGEFVVVAPREFVAVAI